MLDNNLCISRGWDYFYALLRGLGEDLFYLDEGLAALLMDYLVCDAVQGEV